MAIISEDFDRFLMANYPDDWSKITVKDVKPDVINYVLSKTEAKYELWKRIPEWIKVMYVDKLPEEVLRGNAPWDDFVLHLEKTNYDYNKVAEIVYNSILTDEKNVQICNNILNKGYGFENAVLLTEAEIERKKLKESGELDTPEGKEKWRKSREKTRDLIVKDWKENQPEKWVLNQIKEYDRNIRRAEKAKTAEEKLRLRVEASKNKREFDVYINNIKDKELKIRLIKLYKTVMNNHSRLDVKNGVDVVNEYMQQASTRAAARNISIENVSVLKDMLANMRR